MTRPIATQGFLFFSLLFSSFALQAHPGHQEIHGFLDGFIHPFTGLDHFLTFFTVGLWASQTDKKNRYFLPGLFLGLMLLGLSLGYKHYSIPFVEVGICFSLIIVGLLLTKIFMVNSLIASFIISFFAIFHGHAHGLECAPLAEWVEYGVGMTTATSFLYTTGLGVGLLLGNLKLFNSEGLLKLGGVITACVGVFYLSMA